MAIESIGFKGYKIVYYSPVNDGAGQPQATIYLYQDVGLYQRGTLSFYKDGTALPENAIYDPPPPKDSKIYLRFHLSRFNDVITILREEKPLSVNLDTSTKEGWVSTGEGEIVGEEEGS